MLGNAVLDGSSALITLVGSEVADVEPALFVAVTTRRVVEPIMLANSPSVVPVAPEISLQEPPDPSQSSHCREKLKGSEPDHPPTAPVNAEPSISEPTMLGSPVFDGSRPLIRLVGSE